MRALALSLAILSLTLAGCTATDTAAIAGAAGAPMPEDRGGYVQMAAASDMFEIQSSQLAATRAQRPEVRQFAQMMIAHHTQTTAQLTAAAQASGITPQPMLNSMQAAMMRELQQATAFDQVYMRQQVAAHEMALALHSNYAARGDTPALRTVAAAAAPIVQQHLTRAQQLN